MCIIFSFMKNICFCCSLGDNIIDTLRLFFICNETLVLVDLLTELLYADDIIQPGFLNRNLVPVESS